jgi:hypothetical protein
MIVREPDGNYYVTDPTQPPRAMERLVARVVAGTDRVVFADNAATVEHCTAVRVDLPALRAALATIKAHEALIDAASIDAGACDEAGIACVVIVAALEHIVEDGYRSDATRGGS